jgi:hypothetical protein
MGKVAPSKLSMASSSDSIGSNASSRRIRKTRNISELKKTANVNSPKRQKISFLEFITEKLAGTDNTNSYGIIKPNKQQVLPNCDYLEELTSRQADRPQGIVDLNGDIQEKWYSPKPLTPYQFNHFI